ncbi:MAG: hypothetical protein AAF830_05195 [Pseudomonadota bacterium]
MGSLAEEVCELAEGRDGQSFLIDASRVALDFLQSVVAGHRCDFARCAAALRKPRRHELPQSMGREVVRQPGLPSPPCEPISERLSVLRPWGALSGHEERGLADLGCID